MAGAGGGKLTEKAVKAFVAQGERGSKLADGGGLHLFVTPAGGTIWRVKYRIDGKPRIYSVGRYPLVSLAAARVELGLIKALLRDKKDPVSVRRANRAANAARADRSFQAVAQEWLAAKQKDWSAAHYAKSARAFERSIYPALGALPIAHVPPAAVVKVLEEIHRHGVAAGAGRVLQHLNGVFRYAQAKGLCRENPAAQARATLPRKKDGGRTPALSEWPALGEVLRRAEAARLSPAVRMAHRLCAFTAARIGTVVKAEWREFHLDGDGALWIVPSDRLKAAGADQHIPLCPHIAAELRLWREVFGNRGFVFPAPQGGKHIGRDSLEKLYCITLKLKGKHSPRAWRTAFSLRARAQGFAPDLVDLALGHPQMQDAVRPTDGTERLPQRADLYRWWGEHLAAAQHGAKIIPLPGKAAVSA